MVEQNVVRIREGVSFEATNPSRDFIALVSSAAAAIFAFITFSRRPEEWRSRVTRRPTARSYWWRGGLFRLRRRGDGIEIHQPDVLGGPQPGLGLLHGLQCHRHHVGHGHGVGIPRLPEGSRSRRDHGRRPLLRLRRHDQVLKVPARSPYPPAQALEILSVRVDIPLRLPRLRLLQEGTDELGHTLRQAMDDSQGVLAATSSPSFRTRILGYLYIAMDGSQKERADRGRWCGRSRSAPGSAAAFLQPLCARRRP